MEKKKGKQPPQQENKHLFFDLTLKFFDFCLIIWSSAITENKNIYLCSYAMILVRLLRIRFGVKEVQCHIAKGSQVLERLKTVWVNIHHLSRQIDGWERNVKTIIEAILFYTFVNASSLKQIKLQCSSNLKLRQTWRTA